MTVRKISDQEIKYLDEKAKSYIDLRDFEQALRCYNQIIENVPPHPYYFSKRASAFVCIACLNKTLKDLDKAIEDINMAIKLDAQEGRYFWRRGAFLSYRLTIDKNISYDDRKKLLEEVIKNYEASMERDPLNSQAWLDLIETNIILHNWDDAIGKYGECKPYIDLKEEKLIRTWLGCLALTFAGDPLEEEDKKPLFDQTIRLNKSHWYTAHINHVLDEMHEKEGYKQQWEKAKEIHELFLSHFDESPW